MSEGIERQRGRRRRRGKEILKGSSHTMGALSLSSGLPRVRCTRAPTSRPCWPILGIGVHLCNTTRRLPPAASPRCAFSSCPFRRLSLRTLVVSRRVGVRGYRTGSSSLRGEPPSWWRVAASFPPLGPRLGSESPLSQETREILSARRAQIGRLSDLGETLFFSLSLFLCLSLSLSSSSS